ncbi:MAG: lysoplasmalogenase [Actinomycetota bacterium]|nr:lysoplasmalogenase [Actinomycetota bacterium]
MTAAATIALVVAIPFAAGDWWSRLRDDRRLEVICKPATLVALIVAAATLDPAAGEGDRRVWFVAALVFSLAGDVFLLFPARFIAGLAAFLVAHLCYVAGFWTDPPAATSLVVSAVFVSAVLAPVAFRILRAVREAGPRGDVGPVAAYVGVISAMVVSALASGNAVAGVGAVVFAGSDSLIAWDRFVRSRPWMSVTIMVTYHLGQLFLVLSLLE